MTITLTREEAQQVLDALRAVEDLTTHDDEVYAAIDIIEPLLAQPEPEPVAWIVSNSEYDDEFVNNPSALAGRYHRGGNPTPVYIAPPQREWQGLTDEEISELIRNTHNTGSFIRAIEQALREKNT